MNITLFTLAFVLNDYTRNYLFSPLIDSVTLHSRMNPGQPRSHYLIPIDKLIDKFIHLLIIIIH